eukprot:gene3050-5222_t
MRLEILQLRLEMVEMKVSIVQMRKSIEKLNKKMLDLTSDYVDVTDDDTDTDTDQLYKKWDVIIFVVDTVNAYVVMVIMKLLNVHMISELDIPDVIDTYKKEIEKLNREINNLKSLNEKQKLVIEEYAV